MMVAALFVESRGAYFGVPDVDPWDERRDARKYAGPHPVVAHPPCSRWCRLAGLVEARWGHKRGADGGCFASALKSVRSFGGVLEHPAYSDAWAAFDLPVPPRRGGWVRGICGGWSCHVEQGRYGHAAKKATWLYAYGADLPSLKWGSDPDQRSKALVSWCCNHVKSGEVRPRVGKAAASRTPPPIPWRSDFDGAKRERTMSMETTTSETTSDWDGAAEASAEADGTPKKMGTAELELPCLLTDAELLERGEALSKELALIEEIKVEASEAAAQHRESRKSSEKVAAKLARTIRTKTEDRRVPCTVYHVLSLGLARTVRDDTGEVVSERPLSYAERQPSLFDGDAEDAPATDADGEDDPSAITDPDALLDAGDEEDAGEA